MGFRKAMMKMAVYTLIENINEKMAEGRDVLIESGLSEKEWAQIAAEASEIVYASAATYQSVIEAGIEVKPTPKEKELLLKITSSILEQLKESRIQNNNGTTEITEAYEAGMKEMN